MAEHHQLTDAELAERPDAAIDAVATKSLIAGVIGLIALGAGYFIDRSQFLDSYLVAFVFVICIVLGCLALTMVHHLTGGAWGMICRRIWEAASRTMPILALMFLPIAFNIEHIYSWAMPGAESDPIIQLKKSYLNEGFFFVRAFVFFAVWTVLAYFLSRWSKEQDTTPAQPAGDRDSRFRVLSGPGLVLYVLTVTFMAVDWIMSLDPHWYSTMFGVIFIGAQGLAAIAFSILMVSTLSHTRPLSHVLTPTHLHDLGKLMLAFVMLWAYFNFSQFLIIYSANLPEEIPFYLRRLQGGWGWLSIALVVGHFALPFALLLSQDLKKNRRKLMSVAAFVLAMRVIDLIWNIGPMFHHETERAPIHWMDFAAVLALGGIWMFFFARQLKGRTLVPYKDPYYKESMHVAH
ncbi:MAG: hypothetical protein M3R55_16390 [Acidobacteriota bacterium]|nr:hypothetical protein [Acidobacteriota bacterium]